MIATTPRGFKDVLPEEARIREKILNETMKVMDLWGYDPIETPSLEVQEVIEQGSKLDDSTFKLFDGDNSMLVLRPDVTLSIARMVASRLPEESVNRFRYGLSVFRDNDSSKGSSREFTQIGIEQIGIGGPVADAETLIVFVESLMAAGLKGFKIEFCNVEILKALLDECGSDDAFRKAVLDAYHTSNYVKLDETVDAAGISPDLAKALKGLIRIHGGEDAIEECRDLLGEYVRGGVFSGLSKTWSIVAGCGYSDYVGIDFSLLNSFDYYTGLIMSAFVPNFGKSIGSGGRYDNLLGVFGKSRPAAGFAFSLERLMHALAVQEGLDTDPRNIEMIEANGIEDFKKAMAAHSKGIAAAMGGAR